MKIEQQVGGSAANQDAYTGVPRQLTVDTDNYDLRLHDGVTPGGRLIPSRDNNDERYQGKSAELAGFSFAAAERGFIARIGPGVYRLRVFGVNPANLEIVNANGYGGNPTIGLKEEIATPHHFLDDILIDGVLQVVGGINGNVSGNTSGTHTGQVSGPTTGAHVGPVDVRGAILQLDDGQIPAVKISGLVAAVSAGATPIGGIIMWSGAIVDIPARWALCDGASGTPNLTDRFVVGAGAGFAVGASGGAAAHSHATSLTDSAGHTHAVTVDGHVLTVAELPAHDHFVVCDVADSAAVSNVEPISSARAGSYLLASATAGVANVGVSSPAGTGTAHSHTGSTASDGVHNHTVNNPTASSYPPYYALCYIMRVT